MKTPGPFERFDDDDVRRLVSDYPLAWVVPTGGDSALAASQLPLVAVHGEDGSLLELIGHMARHNPLARVLEEYPQALVLFSGPQGYVSPEHVGRRDWGPTWNYAHLRMLVEITFVPDKTRMTLDLLIGAMEKGRDNPWSTDALGSRFDRLLPAIVGFRARVLKQVGRFKLGQDDALTDRTAIVSRHPNCDLVRWMKQFLP